MTGCVLVYYEKFFVWLAVVLLLIIVHGDGVKVYCFGLCSVSKFNLPIEFSHQH